MDIGKRWRLARGGGWQEVEIGKRWRLTKDGGWQEIEVGKRWRLARGGGSFSIIVLCKSLPNSLAADAGLLSRTPTFRSVHQHSTINATATPHLHLKGN